MNRHLLGMTGVFVTACAAGALVMFGGAPAGAGQDVARKPALFRIGTFQRADVMVAYHRSKQHDDVMKELIRKRDEARAAGDEARVKELEAQGAAMQERAHRQLAGEAPITNILAHLKEAWPAIAREAGVDAIVEATLFASENVETVDVTSLVVKQFPPAHPDRKSSEPKAGG